MKKIKLKESDLINLIEKLVKENFAAGNGQNFGMMGTPTSKYAELLEKDDVEETDDGDEGYLDDPGMGGDTPSLDDQIKNRNTDRGKFDGRDSEVVGVDSDIDKQRMGESKKKTLKLTESQLINMIEKVIKQRKK